MLAKIRGFFEISGSVNRWRGRPRRPRRTHFTREHKKQKRKEIGLTNSISKLLMLKKKMKRLVKNPVNENMV